MNFIVGQQSALDPASVLATITNMGMVCKDQASAYGLLERVSYFHLKYGYLVAFRTPGLGDIWSISPVYEFSDLIELYRFDSDLKGLCNEVAETFELRLRNYVAQEMGGGVAGGLGFDTFHEYLDLSTSAKRGDFKNWKNQAPASMKKSLQGKIISSVNALAHEGETPLRPEQVPLWALTEVIEFGKLEILYGLMKESDKSRIAARFGIKDVDFLDAVIRMIRETRNIVAHYSPLWCQFFNFSVGNVTVGNGPFKDSYNALVLQMLMGGGPGIYDMLSVLSFISQETNSGEEWRDRMKSHLMSFESLNLPFGLENLGFNDKHWKASALWETDGIISIPSGYRVP